MTRQTFFEHSVLERDLGDDFFQLPVLASQIFDFVTGGFSDGVTSQLFLPCFEKVLAPSVVEVRGDAFSSAQIGDALLASQSFENNADLILRGELPSGSTADLSDCGFTCLLLLIGHLDTLLGIMDPGMCFLA
jgi:hypothetical protein